jgi:hypothetical protein
MATISSESLFSRWNLTKEELRNGSTLSITQKQCIQNQICDLAHQRLAINLDTEAPLKSLQLHSELGGQIAALSYLIDISNAAEAELLAERQFTSGE